MKNSFFALLLSLTTTALFAEPSIQIPTSTPTFVIEPDFPRALPDQETLIQKQGFFYVRFIAGEHSFAAAPVPGLGLGYRRLAGDGTADISFSGIGISEYRNSRYFWTAPKASYYHYLYPNGKTSFYVGGGLAWGGVGGRHWDDEDDTSERLQFIGIIPSATVGYEFAHKLSFLGFSELTVSQPVLAISRSGAFPGPIAELSVGMGF
jgi:hypothetical protein